MRRTGRPSRAEPEPASVDTGGGRIRRLSIPTPFPVGPVNCYLVECETLALVDTGPNDPVALDALERGLAGLGCRLEDVELLILTHQHYDHCGLASEIKRRSGADVTGHALLASFLADYDAAIEAEEGYAFALMALHGLDVPSATELHPQSRSLTRYGSSVAVDKVLSEGDVLELGAWNLVVALRPGHSPTDTIFVEPTHRFALVGDHLIAHISSNAIVHRPRDAPADPRDRRSALATYLDSLALTLDLDVERLLPGHGRLITDHKSLIADRFAYHERRKLRILQELQRRPATAGELVPVMWNDLPDDEIYLALSEVLGHLDLLISDGRVEVREHDGVLNHVAN